MESELAYQIGGLCFGIVTFVIGHAAGWQRKLVFLGRLWHRLWGK